MGDENMKMAMSPPTLGHTYFNTMSPALMLIVSGYAAAAAGFHPNAGMGMHPNRFKGQMRRCRSPRSKEAQLQGRSELDWQSGCWNCWDSSCRALALNTPRMARHSDRGSELHGLGIKSARTMTEYASYGMVICLWRSPAMYDEGGPGLSKALMLLSPPRCGSQ